MKILVIAHDFNNVGGILNHTEQLMAGFKDLGHEVELLCVKASKKSPGKLTKDLSQYTIGEGSGYPIHQGNGWGVPYEPFLSSEWIQSFIKRANEFDMVIWESIFGFKSKETEGETEWVKMITNLDAKVKQIAIVHDGNLLKYYPWIHKLKDNISGLACVHPSAFESAEQMEIPRSLIVNPQKPIERGDIPFNTRKNQILSLQTFKRWKRVDDLVAAIPHMSSYAKVIIAGDGIERAYMTSKDKCKEEYFCTLDRDPDAKPEWLSNKIWDNALDNGMEYIGFISEQKRDSILSESKFLIDTSWSRSYGSHFNRVIVDAMRVGVVPIARNLGVSDNLDGITDLLKPNENYLMIPYDETPKMFAEHIKRFMDISEDNYQKIVENNYKLVDNVFSRKEVAARYIELANNPNLDLNSLQSKKVKETIDEIWCNHFGFTDRIISKSTLDSFF
jgi:glycosyltransferase involved in cell wall biosynthesis